MSDFKNWQKKNETKINLATRQELVEMAWNAALESQQEKPVLFFRECELGEYETTVMLTLEAAEGFEIDAVNLEKADIDQIQQRLNKEHIIDIVSWLAASQKSNKVIELSNGDVIDFSVLSGEEGTGTQCQRAFYGIVKPAGINSRFIEVCEVVEK